MDKCRISDLACKEVININNGCRFGCVCDAVFDAQSGKLSAIIVPAKRERGGFFERSYEYEIPWENVQQIGDDYIFVDFEINHVNTPQKRRVFF